MELMNSLNFCYQSDNLCNIILLMKASIIIYLLALTISTNCQFWYYSYEYHDESFYTCYRQQSNTNSLALALILNADSTISNYSLQNVANAKSAGLTLTALFQPCRNIPAETHLQNLNKAFPFKVMDKYWLELRVGAGDCGWDIYPPFGNCYFLQDLIVKIQNQLNSAVGIVTDRETWYKIFKDYQGCPDISGYADLWWIPTAASPQPNFDDFVKIGGWYRPFTKLQTTKSFCSATFYQNFYTPF